MDANVERINANVFGVIVSVLCVDYDKRMKWVAGVDRGLVLPDLSYKVVGVCMKVHNELGPTMLEKYYQRAVERELVFQKINFVREKPVEINYGGESIGRYFLDFVIEERLVLELKACKQDLSGFHKQVFAYLRQLDLGLGIVVNFRGDRLTPYRVINSEWVFRLE